MTFVLVGAGALGRTFGTLLAAAGYPVVLIGRPVTDVLGRLETMHVHGAIESSAPVRTGRPEPGTVTVGQLGDELPRGAALLFTTKAHQLAEAAKAVVPYWPAAADPGAWTAGFQNGLLTGDVLAEKFGPDRVLGASTVVGARRAGDGAAVASVGMTYLGELDGGRSERVDVAAAAFRDAGLPCDGAQDIRGVLWAKMCHAVAVFGISALTGLPTAQIMTSRPLVRAYHALITEAASVARAAGVAIADYPDLPLRTYLELPAEELAGRLTAGRPADDASTPPSFSSMAQDLAAGRPTEHDEIFGDLLRRSSRLGVQIPRISLIRDVVAGLDPGAR